MSLSLHLYILFYLFLFSKHMKMKFLAMEPPFTKNQSVQRPPKKVLLITFTLVFLALISLQYPLPEDPFFESKSSENAIFLPKRSSNLESTSSSNHSRLVGSKSSENRIFLPKRSSNHESISISNHSKSTGSKSSKNHIFLPKRSSNHESTSASNHSKSVGSKRSKNSSNHVSTSTSNHSKLVRNSSSTKKFGKEKCDIFTGEWVRNPEAPYYTNLTCNSIHEHQNCMKFGRPDTDFLKWRWKPDGCELPVFDPAVFLRIVRGKSLAFIGDSVARNQMQSLMCLISRVVEDPEDISELYSSDLRFKRFRYPSYNFTLATFWSPYLVRTKEIDPKDPDHKGPFNLYLDEFDEDWTTKIEDFDYIIISAGHWFFRPTMYSQDGRLVGCLYCPLDNVKHLPMSYAYRRAFRTAFRAINSIRNFKGITFLRTFAPSHFEGKWDAGGNCLRQKPFRRNETTLEGTNLELHTIQLQEFKIAEREGRKRGLKFRLLDTTQATLLRPDGHPSRYGHLPHANVSLYNDCVHWCLPGPIDTWNDFLLDMLKTK